ncbi:MmgE/PrpD family protein [Salinigranum rubrum]|uniref:MmgE/PrpD family protein n=1 Tax=Salinigranum rubrum TaxID=755307 RepID=A0A2I8VIB0_9EURY|nr:MmgE/PrpD family protein [Salinigranum rubrum]AUV80789.1 MmgE/PrpD family protein [Salinigranum rubrum]
MNETVALARFVEETSLTDVPDDVRQKAKEAITDLVGVAVYGSYHEVGERVASYVDATFAEGTATVFGRGDASPPGAALANASFGHAVDFDDTFESIVIHPTSPVFSAALAVGEQVDATGPEVLTAYVVGVEAAYRTGHSTYPEHYENGWHSTGTVGTFGATAAAASVMGLPTEQVRHAFGIAASGSSALKKNFGTMTKPLHSGHAAQMGVRAATLAAEGFTADPSVFEGKIGYGTVMTPGGTYDPDELTEDLGETWAVMDIGYKPYPSGVITHAAMDALREIVVDHDLEPEDVETVTVALDDAASEMLHHANPETGLEAKFSIEFCLASVLLERDPGIHEFTDEYVTAPATREQTRKVTRAFEENLFGGNYANYAARVEVTTVEGERLSNEMIHAPGSPNNPLSEERLRAKFDECARDVLSDADADDAYEAIMDLESDDAVDRLTDAVSA